MSFNESCDGKELAGLAKRFPTLRASVNTDVQNKKNGQRRCQVKLADLALKYPELAVEVWGVAEGMLLSHLQSKQDSDDKFNEQYKQCWRIPGGWKAAFVEVVSHNKITQVMLADYIKQGRACSGIEHEVFYFLTKSQPHTKLPEECQSKKVCQGVFTRRHEEWWLRRRIDMVLLVLSGKSSWHEVGPYTVEFDDVSQMATKVTYDSGEMVDIPADDSFSKQWTFFDAHLDDTCHVKHPQTKRCVKLSTYLPEGEGPNWKGTDIDVLAEVVFSELQQEVERMASSLATDSCSIVTKVNRDTKRLAAQARAADLVKSNKKRKEEGGKSLEDVKFHGKAKALAGKKLKALVDEAASALTDEAAVGTGGPAPSAGAGDIPIGDAKSQEVLVLP